MAQESAVTGPMSHKVRGNLPSAVLYKKGRHTKRLRVPAIVVEQKEGNAV